MMVLDADDCGVSAPPVLRSSVSEANTVEFSSDDDEPLLLPHEDEELLFEDADGECVSPGLLLLRDGCCRAPPNMLLSSLCLFYFLTLVGTKDRKHGDAGDASTFMYST